MEEKIHHRVPTILDLSQSTVVIGGCVLCIKGGKSDSLPIGASFSAIRVESDELLPFLSASYGVFFYTIEPMVYFFTPLCTCICAQGNPKLRRYTAPMDLKALATRALLQAAH